MMTRRILCTTAAAILLAAAVPGVQGQEPTRDPLTGEIISAPEMPARADLNEANALIRESRYPEAVTLLAGLREEYPDDPSLLLMLGELLLATGKPADAIPVLRKAGEVAPERERIHFQLGAALLSAGDPDGALAAFETELGNTSNTEIIVLSRLNRSMILERSRDWSSAAEELEMVLQVRPDKKEIYGDLASLYLRAEDPDRAIQALQRGEEAGFLSADHYYSLGARLYHDARYEQAVEAFRSTLDLVPDKAAAVRSLAASLEKVGREAEAAEQLKRYLELRPDDPDRAEIEAQIKAVSGGNS